MQPNHLTPTSISAKNPQPSASAPVDRADADRRPVKSDDVANVTKSDANYDRELVRRFNSGDEPAFNEIVARHQRKVFHTALNVLGNRADADEISQDTFVRAYRGLARFRGDSSLATWLHQIALNLARNRYWYFFRRGRHTTLSFDGGLDHTGESKLTDFVALDTPSPDRDMITGEFLNLVASGLEQLDQRHREILLLRCVRDCSYEEIAYKLGICVGTVKSRVARARAETGRGRGACASDRGRDHGASDGG